MARVVVLVGMMGSGKTTVGRRLATKLGFRFIDTDDLVVAKAGKPVREIFEHDGEPAFRELESDAVRDAVASPVDTVVAAAGGCVLSDNNRSYISERASYVVWLDADVSALGQRTSRSAHRPLLDGDAESRLAALDEARRPLYQSIADVRLDTTPKSVDEVVEEIASLVDKVRAS